MATSVKAVSTPKNVLPIKRIIDISNLLAKPPVARRTFGKLLFITKTPDVAGAMADGDVRTYSQAEDVSKDFGSNSEPHKASLVYFRENSNADLHIGFDSAGTITEPVYSAMKANQKDFYTVILDSSYSATAVLELAIRLEVDVDRDVIQIRETTDVKNKDGSDTTSLSHKAKEGQYKRLCVIYTDTAQHIDCALAGSISKVDYTPSRPAKSYANKSLDGIVVSSLSVTEANVLDGYFTNYYHFFGEKDRACFERGYVSAGYHIDEIQNADWLKYNQTYDFFDYLLNVEKINFNQAGYDLVEHVITDSLEVAYRANVIGEGYDIKNDVTLLKGYEVIMPDIKDAKEVDRNKRVIRGIRTRLLFTGAVESIEIVNDIQL